MRVGEKVIYCCQPCMVAAESVTQLSRLTQLWNIPLPNPILVVLLTVVIRKYRPLTEQLIMCVCGHKIVETMQLWKCAGLCSKLPKEPATIL